MADRFEDLMAWKLAGELQVLILAFTAKGPAANDFRFSNQIRDSCRSARSNIAEGFGRYYPQEFIRFLQIARGSLQETLNHLIEGHERNFWTEEDFVAMKRLTLRSMKAISGLIRYLERTW